MNTQIENIVKFNRDAGLLEAGYDDFLESSMLIEEALEGFPLDGLTALCAATEANTSLPKHVSRGITAIASGGTLTDIKSVPIRDVDRLDKACDAVFIAVGSIAKLRLNPEQIARALDTVTSANLAKLTCPKDKFGKLTKPSTFVGPEAALQRILDER